MNARSRLLLLLLLPLAGCTGYATGGDDKGTPPGPTPGAAAFRCDPAKLPAELPLRRLTSTQYVRTVQDLVRATPLASGDKDAVLSALAQRLERFPPDRRVTAPGDTHGGFVQLDQVVQQSHVDASYEVAVALGKELTSSPGRRSALLGACATDASSANDEACLRGFITRFGRQALRRPVDSAQVDALVAAAGSTPVAPETVADVIGMLLSAPHFLYLVEEAPAAWSGTGPAPLDAWALASRLSYHFWQTLPDAELLAAAESGALLTAEGYQAQVERLFADARTERVVQDFFSQWLRLNELRPLNTRVGTPVFDAFAGEDVPSARLHQEMVGEIGDLVTWVMRNDKPLGEVLTSRKSFARTESLAALYRQPRWDGTSAPQDFVEPARVGLLTRAALLASASGNTRPVMKGFHIRNALLCQTIPPPPDNANVMPIELSPDLTTREQVERITEQPGSACAGCHSTLLNPFGYVTENFDALGRSRSAQRLFNPDGSARGEKAVNTRASATLGGKLHELANAAEATRVLAQSGLFHTCFARQYFRFAFSRMEDDAQDGCVLAELERQALEDRPLGQLLKAVALRPEFKRRDFR